MNAFLAFLRKELVEIVRTWRLYVLPLVFTTFTVLSIFTAKYLKTLLKSMAGEQSAPPGGWDSIPDPTYLDAFGQAAKSIGQMGMLGVLIVFGGLLSVERKQGTAILMLTKPLSRWSMVIAKFVSASVHVLGSLIIAGLIDYVVTVGLFKDVKPMPLISSYAAWFLMAEIMIAIMMMFSAFLQSGIAVSGIGLGVMFMLSILELWGPAVRHSPVGINTLVSEYAKNIAPNYQWTAIGTGFACVALFLTLAGLIFRRREI